MAGRRLIFERRRVCTALAALLVAGFCMTAPAVARAPKKPVAAAARSTQPASEKAISRFDGRWSVLIVTDAGTCDRAYRYAIHISNGKILYGDSGVDLSGHVAPNGQVEVGVNFGEQRAIGTGQLSADFGQGQWTGHSTSSRCSGHWEAERRG